MRVHRVIRLRLLPITTLAGALGIVLAACVSDDPAIGDPADPTLDASVDTSQPPGPDTGAAETAPPSDAGTDADAEGETITDGGALPEEDDAGGVDLDGGFDAGPACGPLAPGAYVASVCLSKQPILTGGPLSTATYELASVHVLGSSTFCSVTFASWDHRGALKVTASSPTTATFELWELYRPSGSIARPSSRRWDADVTAFQTSLSLSPKACAPSKPPSSATYSVGSSKGKKTLGLILPYGKGGTAQYLFVEP